MNAFISNNYILKVFFYIFVLALASCGGGGSDGGNSSGRVSLSATLGSTYNIAQSPSISDSLLAALFGKKALAINNAAFVNQVVAIPSFSGSISPADFENMQTVSIGRDGNFSLSLETSYDWVILLVNSNASTIDDKVAGYVAATIDDYNTLIAFPGSKLSSNLDMGTLENDGVNEAKSSTTGSQNAASFDLTLDELKSIAKSDDSYKHLINLYFNYDPVSKAAYQAQLSYNWDAGTISATGNVIPTTTTISNYQPGGFSVGIETAQINAALKDGICGGITQVELIPPASVETVDASRSWNASNTFKNDADYASGCPLSDTSCMNIGADSSTWLQSNGSENRYYCYDADFSIQVPLSVNNSIISFGFNSSPLKISGTGLPQGIWVYKVNDNEAAWFDLGVASPVSSAGKFNTNPLPAVSIAYDPGTGIINGLTVTWFQFDAASDDYLALTPEQAQAFDSVVQNSFVSMLDDDGADPINNPQTVHLGFTDDPGFSSTGLVDGSNISFPTGSNAWYLPGSAGDQSSNLVPTGVSVGLTMSGVSYVFGWN